MMKSYIQSILLVITLTIACASQAKAQDKQETLFPYISVPDTISRLEDRSNYYITHFWDNANLGKQITDTDKFYQAFSDYIIFFRYAHRNVVRSSVNNLMNKAQSNMKNFWLVAKAAEDNFYSTDGEMKSDEAYMLFLQNIIRSSNVKKNEKTYYQNQLLKINSNQIGAMAPDMTFTDVDGQKRKLYDIATDSAATIIIFFNPMNCSDCSIPRLRLSTNVTLDRMINDGEVVFLNIYLGNYSKEWAETAKSNSGNWIIGASSNAADAYDIPKNMPSIYLLAGDKTIRNKNISAEIILNAIN